MLRIDRMEIDDVGGNPVRLAKAVTNQIADLKPPVPVREIAAAVDIYEIRETSLDNLEGGLITPDDKSEGAILVNADRPEKRKRYTIGHELGHYLNPWHKPPSAEGFRCSSKDMAVEKYKAGDRAGQMEVEANEFSSALLMPPGLFRSHVRRLTGLDLDHVLTLSDRFQVSREAAGRKYVSVADEPAAIVYSKCGVIRYVRRQEDFPWLNCWSGDPLPAGSLSARSTKPVGDVSDWIDLEGEEWLADPRGRRVCEQTLAQMNGYRMTLLALEEPVDDDQEDAADWAPPTFRR